MSKKTIMSISVGIAMSLLSVGMVFASQNPSGTGQPNQSCQAELMQPAGFLTTGFAHAETVYAGSGVSLDHAQSSDAVSQYDVACYQVSQ